MILKRIPVGSYMANCYIFGDKKTKEVIIIDPGDEQHKIFDVIENGGTLKGYVLHILIRPCVLLRQLRKIQYPVIRTAKPLKLAI